MQKIVLAAIGVAILSMAAQGAYLEQLRNNASIQAVTAEILKAVDAEDGARKTGTILWACYDAAKKETANDCVMSATYLDNMNYLIDTLWKSKNHYALAAIVHIRRIQYAVIYAYCNKKCGKASIIAASNAIAPVELTQLVKRFGELDKKKLNVTKDNIGEVLSKYNDEIFIDWPRKAGRRTYLGRTGTEHHGVYNNIDRNKSYHSMIKVYINIMELIIGIVCYDRSAQEEFNNGIFTCTPDIYEIIYNHVRSEELYMTT